MAFYLFRSFIFLSFFFTEICLIRMCDAEFHYTYEYQGNAAKLVHTPLTDKCYLTLTQGMHMGLGGNPYGPAGTGKTESVKALGGLFGRQVLVFNCDEVGMENGTSVCRYLCVDGAGCTQMYLQTILFSFWPYLPLHHFRLNKSNC